MLIAADLWVVVPSGVALMLRSRFLSLFRLLRFFLALFVAECEAEERADTRALFLLVLAEGSALEAVTWSRSGGAT